MEQIIKSGASRFSHEIKHQTGYPISWSLRQRRGLAGAIMMSTEFIRFLLTGGVAAAVNLGSRYFFNNFIGFEIAVVVAYILGMITAYVLARLFVFQTSGRSMPSEFKRFAIVNVFSLGLVWTISVVLAVYLFPAMGFSWHTKDVAHFIGVTAPAAASYVGHRAYTFKSVQA
ncbi:GtrA family protein [Rhodoblastus sp.]|uniref:GtrA family protein n=2 Tax=Rhodoblastus sp. TaxID=1962975 RepID=UPI003F98E1A3